MSRNNQEWFHVPYLGERNGHHPHQMDAISIPNVCSILFIPHYDALADERYACIIYYLLLKCKRPHCLENSTLIRSCGFFLSSIGSDI